MNKIDRRRFLQWMLSGAALAFASRCAPRGGATPGVPAESPTAVLDPGLPEALVPEMPAPTSVPRVIRNENRPGFYIRYYRGFTPVDREKWNLSVEGLIKNPQMLSFADVQALPMASQVSRMKCVEGWSVAAAWEGFAPQTLVDLVEPLPEATWVHFYSADDYYESISLPELLMDRVLFVYGMNGEPLLPEYGAPLRLIVPFKYAYKGPKALTRVVFAGEELRGYWSTVGPYSTEGDVQPGRDYALDLEESRYVEGRGEIFYEDGIESQD